MTAAMSPTSVFAHRSEILGSHALREDPTHALSSVYRETCADCGRSALQAPGGPVYGSASRERCPAPRDLVPTLLTIDEDLCSDCGSDELFQTVDPDRDGEFVTVCLACGTVQD